MATFSAFVLAGTVPLLPFVLAAAWTVPTMFLWSAAATVATFFAVGAAKGLIVQRSAIGSGLETLLVGGGAAILAYAMGYGLRSAFGLAL
jgi:VIT1/CCC1 family predicted Fe2+/Mn2+ transporter